MPEIFMFYLGGSASGANIEVHDVQFAVGDKPEDAFPILVARWFGIKASLHVDAYTVLRWADGWDVTLSREPSAAEERLYFVNLGGYRPDDFAELHKFGLFVATSAGEAKAKAKASLLTDVSKQHRDDQMLVDECLLLADVQGFHIHLKANPRGRPDGVTWQGYRMIGA